MKQNLPNPAGKYRRPPRVNLPDRLWPDREIAAAPRWCEVGLRDGNQALPNQMLVPAKMEMFKLLVALGFKEIEVGFPSASPTEFTFVRELIEGGHVPDDVTVQVITQAREALIEETVRSLVGAKRAIVHLYCSTSPAQRRAVYRKSRGETLAMVVEGARALYDRLPLLAGTDVTLQLSPESFSATELDFALEVSEAVLDVWQPTRERPAILNLPATVEVSTPNVYADQIEWFSRSLSRRDAVVLSVHTHNDRGTGVAAAELALMAGAERVEGTLFGNGERTGNLDLVTAALNLQVHGVDSGLDFSRLPEVREAYERLTGMRVPERQPYSGELVFTAFSGSHQDAVAKGLRERLEAEAEQREMPWDVPYLAVDPRDVGRDFAGVVRVNGQSGRAGVAFLLEERCGVKLPRGLQVEFGPIAKRKVDALGREASADELREMLWEEYVGYGSSVEPASFDASAGAWRCTVAPAAFGCAGAPASGEGNGPVAAFVHALAAAGVARIEVVDYQSHSLGKDVDAQAIAYALVRFEDGAEMWGVGVDPSVAVAPARAVASALVRHQARA